MEEEKEKPMKEKPPQASLGLYVRLTSTQPQAGEIFSSLAPSLCCVWGGIFNIILGKMDALAGKSQTEGSC